MFTRWLLGTLPFCCFDKPTSSALSNSRWVQCTLTFLAISYRSEQKIEQVLNELNIFLLNAGEEIFAHSNTSSHNDLSIRSPLSASTFLWWPLDDLSSSEVNIENRNACQGNSVSWKTVSIKSYWQSFAKGFKIENFPNDVHLDINMVMYINCYKWQYLAIKEILNEWTCTLLELSNWK